MKRILVIIILVLSFVCQGQTKMEEIDYKNIVEIKGLVYLKADTTLVSGKVIRYNRKNEAKKYILVSKGEPDESGWMDINNIKFIKPLTTKPFFNKFSYQNWENKQYPYELNRKRLNDEVTRNRLGQDNLISVDVEKNGIYKDEEVKINSINIEDEKDGVWEEYYKNGQLSRKGDYINGKKDGPWDEYHENGQLMSRINYKEGKENGVIKVYHENGQLIMRGFLEDGIQIREWKYYDKNGELIGTENYD